MRRSAASGRSAPTISFSCRARKCDGQAHSWQSDGPGGPNGTVMLGVKDPRKNFAYEVHQYFDSDSSGTHDECSGNENARNAIIRMSEWAREHGTRALLGEFGVSASTGMRRRLEDGSGYDAGERRRLAWLDLLGGR